MSADQQNRFAPGDRVLHGVLGATGTYRGAMDPAETLGHCAIVDLDDGQVLKCPTSSLELLTEIGNPQ